MRVRILRDIQLSGTPGIRWTAGSVAEVTPDIAQRWIVQGVAMEDRGPSENKIDGPGETKEERKKRLTRERVQKYRNKANGG